MGYGSRGLPVPDPHARRAALAKRYQAPPQYQAISDDAKKLSYEELLIQEIAKRLRSDRATVRKAIAYWYESRQLQMPDGRTRRKTLTRRVSRPYRSRSTRNDRDNPGHV